MKTKLRFIVNTTAISTALLIISDLLALFALSYLLFIATELRSPLLEWMTNSDQLTIPSFINDLSRSWNNYAGWNIPRAPYFSPDVITYTAASLFTDDFRLCILFSALVQIVTTIAVLGYALSLVTGRSRRICRYMVLAAIASVSLLVERLNVDVFHYTFMWLYSPFLHFIYFIIGILCVCLTFRFPRKTLVQVGVFLLIILAVFSDQLFLINYNIPVCGLLIFLALTNRIFQFSIESLKLRTLAFFFARDTSAALIGIILGRLQNRQIMPAISLSIGELFRNLSIIYHTVPPTKLAGLIVLWIPLFLSGVLIVSFLLRLRLRQRKLPPQKFMQYILLFYFALAAAISVAAALPIFSAPNCYRYLVAFFLAPLAVVFATVLNAEFKNRPLLRNPWPLLLILPLFFLGMYIEPLKAEKFTAQLVTWKFPAAQDLEACARQYNLKAGLADYWTSRRILMSSNWSLHVNQMDPGSSKPFYWGSNLLWFTHDFLHPEKSLDYNFILLTKENKHDVLYDYGDPQGIVTCGATEVALYDSTKLTAAVQAFIDKIHDTDKMKADIVAWAETAKDGEGFALNISTLKSQTGRFDNGIWHTEKTGRKSGYFIYGPYVTLPKGRYKMQIQYLLKDGGSPVKWDIASNTGNTSHGSIILPVTENAHGKKDVYATTSLDMTLPTSTPLIESRIFTDGTNELALKDMRIMKQTAE